MYLLDTNTLIYLFKQQGDVARRLQQTPAAHVFIPTLVWFELSYGLLRSTRPEQQQRGMETVSKVYGLLPLDTASAHCAAQVKHTLDSAGTPIGPMDTLIAGIALAHDLTLVTRNTREFVRVPGLRVQDWYTAPTPI